MELGREAKLRPVLVKQRPERTLTRSRLAEQTLMTDLADVARLEIDLNGEAILQFEQLRRVELGPWVVLGESLLCSRDQTTLCRRLPA